MRIIVHHGRTRFPTSIGTQKAFSDWAEIRFTKVLHRETGDSLWLFVDALRTTTRQLPLVNAALRHGVSQRELSAFKGVISSANIDNALSILRDQGFVTSNSDVTASERKHLPMWLLVLLINQKVMRRTQTGSMLDLLSSHLPITPPNLKHPLLVMTTLPLARFNVLSPLREIVQLFLTSPLVHPALLFNLLLQAISRFPSSIEAANQVVTILSAMESRQIPLHSRTYSTLLLDRFVTLQLAKTLRARMIHDGFVPTASHLEAYLRIFAKNGAIHKAKDYLHAIRQLRNTDVPDDETNSLIEPKSSCDTTDTLALMTFRYDSASAFQYLMRLLNIEKVNPPMIENKHHRPPRPPRFFSSKKRTVDIYDWTTALAVAARDKKVSSKALKHLFEGARARTKAFRPSVVTYTVILRGLLHRGEYTEAKGVWEMLINEGLVLDRKALTVGLQVLTGAGEPHKALDMLELFAAKPDAYGAVPLGSQSRPPGRIQEPIIVTSIDMNEFLVALLKIGRPDVVFKLWDNMEAMYGVSPDAATLSILLDSARLSAQLDDSLAGVLSHLASRNPFRRRTVGSPTRQDIVSGIKQMLVDSSGGNAGYRTMLWNDVPAWQWTITVFQQVVLGNWPELRNVQPPARAIRTMGKVASLRLASEQARRPSGPHNDRYHVNSFTSFTGLPDSMQSPLYPQIFPEDATFFEYIRLLGLQALASEIPIALAWMRSLRIMPSTDTLAMALVFWAEVSLYSPLIETLVGERSEYTKLVRWIRDWVGDEKVPKEKNIRHWLRAVATMREVREAR
jgi:pentatricopeptide repeat protein